MSTVRKLRTHKRRAALWITLAVAVLLALGLAAVAIANPFTTNDMNTPLTATQVAQELVGPGVTISNAKFTGAPVAAGTFSGGSGIIGFDKGIILSTGNIADVKGPNDTGNKGTANNTAGDAALSALAGVTTYDAAALEFDVTTKGKTLFFSYVFASEEYNNYVGSKYNDVFAFWLNGVNYATVGSPAKPVSINTINDGTNGDGVGATHPELFVNNNYGTAASTLNTQMDGLTKTLTFIAPIKPNTSTHLKLAIADTGDSSYDSVVFIKADSLATDSKRPTPLVKALTVKRNKVGKIQYEVKDPLPSSGKAKVTLNILNRSGKVVKSLKLGLQVVNKWLKYPYKFSMAKGKYLFNIYATDLAGNKQTKIGKAVLKVN